MPAQATQTKTVNGVNVDALFETIDAIKAQPVISKFKFSLENRWMGGGHNQSTIKNFYGACENVERPQAFVLDADEPPMLPARTRAPIRSSICSTLWPLA